MIGEAILARINAACVERTCEYLQIGQRRTPSALFVGDKEFAELETMVTHWGASVAINNPSGYNPRTGTRGYVCGCLIYRVDAETFLAVI